MKILLLGKNGQIGQELQRSLLPLGEVTALDRNELDLIDFESIQKMLSLHQPSILINAAGYTAVDQAESENDMALKVNAEAVKLLADYCKNTGSLLVHYSTDYVFDGNKSSPYNESDEPNPLNYYGFSKRAGEKAIMKSGCPFLIFRTSWVYSLKGRNFLKSILKQAKDRKTLKVISDQFGAPTSVELIADVTMLAISYHQKKLLQNGLYHLTASGSTSWYELASYVLNHPKTKHKILDEYALEVVPVTSSEYPLPAKRPKNSQLNTGLISKELGCNLPAWSVYVDRFLDKIDTLEL